MLRLLTTADTEILAAAHALTQLGDDFPEVRCANPSTLEDLAAFTSGAGVVVVRLLGGRRAWPEGVSELRSRCEQQGTALILLGGEAEPDAELAELSLAPAGAVAQAFEYLRHGGVDNTRELLNFLSDTFALTGYGFEDPQPLEDVGFYPANPERDGRPRVGVVFYRSHFATGNTAFIDALSTAIEEAGGQAVPVWAYSLRGDSPALKLLDGEIDALITTMLASGRITRGRRVARRGARSARRARHPGAVRDHVAPALGRVGLRPHPARRRDAGRDPRVRRPHHRRPDLLQGADRRRAVRGAALRARPRALRPPRAARRQPRAAADAGPERAADRHRAQLLPDQARADRQRGGPRHARQRDDAAGGAAGGRAPGRARLRQRRRAHPRPDRDRRPRRRVPLRPPARAGHRAALGRRLHRVVQLAAGRAHAADGRDLGPAARRALHRRRRLRDRGAGAGQRAARHPAAARLRREPGRDLPRPGPRARPPLPRDLPLAVPARRRDRPPRQARHAGVAAGQGARV